MSELKKTLAFVATAAIFMTGAVLATRARTAPPAIFNDQGQPFFPEFKEPESCTTLEVVDYDAATAAPIPFKVSFKDGKWVIPSAYDYPADARDRLAKTAGAVLGLVKDTVRSDSREDHKTLGVIDPLDTKATGAEGRGKRITLRDGSDRVLADFIVGKEIPGERSQRYLRVPNENRTYGVVMKAEISTKFTDWIETNLLKIDTPSIRKVEFDGHKVDPERQVIVPGEVLAVSRKDSAGTWTTDGLKPGQEVNPEKMSSLTLALGDLKIAGVRPIPPELTADIQNSAPGKILPTTNKAAMSLMSRGFYPTRNGLESNEGEVRVACEDGVTYKLRFGEVTFAQGEELASGKEDDDPAKGKKDQEKSKDSAKTKDDKPQGVESRYLFVTTEFDPNQVAKPAEDSSGELPSKVFARAPEEIKTDTDKAKRDQEDYDKKIEAGKTRSKDLNDRFATWYYVVPGEAFRGIALNRDALVRVKPPTPAQPPGGGLPFQMPGGGGNAFPGLPAGHP